MQFKTFYWLRNYGIINTSWSDRLGSSQKTFLAFSRTSKRLHWSKLSTKKFFFSFFDFIQRKISLSGDNIFSLATLSAIIYHIRSNYGIWADNQDWVNQSESQYTIISNYGKPTHQLKFKKELQIFPRETKLLGTGVEWKGSHWTIKKRNTMEHKESHNGMKIW